VSRRAAAEAFGAAAPAGKDRVSGKSCRKVILFFIPLGLKADLSDAFDAGLAAAPGANALTEVTVRRETLVTVLYDEYCFLVEGRPVALQRPPEKTSPR
jgi:hypothetical protein